MAALSETRFSEQGQPEGVNAGYTFFWSGRPRAERRDAGVAFAIRDEIVGRLSCVLRVIKDRRLSLYLHPWRDKLATIFSVHASPIISPGAAMDTFFEDVHAPL
ncbi:hypothetical protein SprV_0802512600 [Sparganum proliferum]